MKKVAFIVIVFLLLWTTDYGLSTSFAEIPRLINYQGRLTDSQGAPITGTKSVTLRLYDQASGGSALWQETHTVTFERGIFNLIMGGVTPLNLAFDRQYYLGIQVGDDAEMTPRQQLASSAYAFRANVADILSDPTTIIPRGSVIMWSGSIDSIPQGWALCDGRNGTPDLRNRFVAGAGGSYSPGATGGTTSHNHAGSTASDTSGDYRGWNAARGNSSTNQDASPGYHTHSLTTSSSDVVPPYYALAYIMKL